jgi:hypothetical protein
MSRLDEGAQTVRIPVPLLIHFVELTKPLNDAGAASSRQITSIEPATKYAYPPLLEEDESRLLVVSPGENGSYEYKIVHFSLGSCPDYEAVSYAWGDNDQSAKLFLSDGSYIPISQNLSKAIPFLAGHCQSGYLWIDQLCIRQNDTQERNHQVKMMDKIYRSCKLCLVWLEEEKDLDAEVRAALEVSKLHKQTSEQDTEDALALCLVPNTDIWQRITQILRRPWFTRAWVVQEVILPSESYTIFGSHLLPFYPLVSSLIAIRNAYLESLSATRSWTTSPIFSLNRYYYREKGDRHFHDLLSLLGGESEASDQRDLVYAFLGLNEDTEIDIQPDYSAPVAEVFTSVAKAIIIGTKGLDVFRTLSQFQPQANTGILPTWVTNWKNGQVYVNELPPMNSMGWTASLRRQHIWEESENPKLLRARGQIIDSIRYVRRHMSHLPKHWPLLDLVRYLDIDGVHRILQDFLGSASSAEVLRARILKALLAGVPTPYWLPNSIQHYPGFDSGDVQAMVSAYDKYDYSKVNTSRLPRSLQEAYYKAMQCLSGSTEGRALFVSNSGKLGLAVDIAVGDVIAILHGSDYPMVLRRVDNGQHSIVDVCYFEDAMHGEAVSWEEDKGTEFLIC